MSWVISGVALLLAVVALAMVRRLARQFARSPARTGNCDTTTRVSDRGCRGSIPRTRVTRRRRRMPMPPRRFPPPPPSRTSRCRQSGRKTNNGERLRPRRDRLGHRRLRCRDPRRATRALHRSGRTGSDAGRHLPELGLHSDQGAPRARARAQDCAGLEGVGTDARPGCHRPRHGPGARAQGQDRQGPDRRRRVPVQEEQNRLDQGQRPARRQGQGGSHRRSGRHAHRRQGDHRRHRVAAAERPRDRDRSQAHHHE